MLLSCVKISTISKQTKMRFQLSLVTQEYHWVDPKRFLSQWYVWHKPCTYLASTLTPSPNGPKQFFSLWYVRCKPCTYLASRLALYPKVQNELPLEPCHLVVPSRAPKTIYEPMVRLAQTTHQSCTDLTLSPNRKETRFHMTHVT